MADNTTDGSDPTAAITNAVDQAVEAAETLDGVDRVERLTRITEAVAAAAERVAAHRNAAVVAVRDAEALSLAKLADRISVATGRRVSKQRAIQIVNAYQEGKRP